MSIWVCANCDHQYDTEAGDLANGIAPDTGFDTLPQDWVCPECGAPKIEYAPLKGGSNAGSGWATSNS
jgi:rubredoxin